MALYTSALRRDTTNRMVELFYMSIINKLYNLYLLSTHKYTNLMTGHQNYSKLSRVWQTQTVWNLALTAMPHREQKCVSYYTWFRFGRNKLNLKVNERKIQPYPSCKSPCYPLEYFKIKNNLQVRIYTTYFLFPGNFRAQSLRLTTETHKL